MIKQWFIKRRKKQYDRGYMVIAAQLVKSRGTHLFDLWAIFDSESQSDFNRGAQAAIKDFEVVFYGN